MALNRMHQTHSTQGFSMIEAMVACALMALGLAASVRLSMITLSAAQSVRNLDMASALAQDLGECWGVQTPLCLDQFKSTASFAPFSNDPSPTWTRTWQETDISILGAPSGPLKELTIKVTWPEGDRSSELVWVKRRASTPTWVGS
jgi:Tfp pilus assembly protein PilV